MLIFSFINIKWTSLGLSRNIYSIGFLKLKILILEDHLYLMTLDKDCWHKVRGWYRDYHVFLIYDQPLIPNTIFGPSRIPKLISKYKNDVSPEHCQMTQKGRTLYMNVYLYNHCHYNRDHNINTLFSKFTGENLRSISCTGKWCYQ